MQKSITNNICCMSPSQRDSGGGVVYKKKIYGVISFTGDPGNACTEAVGFMDVCEYKKWIQDTIKPCPGCNIL